MKELLKVTPQTQELWKQMRKSTIGASEIASIAGLNRHQSALEIWMRKTDKLPPLEENDAMFIGKNAEHLVAKMFERKELMTDLEPLEAQILCAHDKYEWATATPDFWLYNARLLTPSKNIQELLSSYAITGLLETKMQGFHQLDSWGENKAPEQYHIQVLWGLGVTGLKKAYIAALIGGFEYRSAYIEFDEELFDMLIELGEAFMECVKTDTPPVTAGANDSKLIKQLIPTREGACELPIEAFQHVQSYLMNKTLASELRAKLKEIEDTQKTEENTLKLLMGSNEFGTINAVCEGKRIRVDCNVKTINRKAYEVAETSYNTISIKLDEQFREPSELIQERPDRDRNSIV